jgi:phasin family protein
MDGKRICLFQSGRRTVRQLTRRQMMLQNTSNSTFTSPFNGAPALSFLAVARVAITTSEKIIQLNMQQIRTHLEDSSATLTDMLSAKDPQLYVALAAEHSRQSYGKLVAHFAELTQIANGLQASTSGGLGEDAKGQEVTGTP